MLLMVMSLVGGECSERFERTGCVRPIKMEHNIRQEPQVAPTKFHLQLRCRPRCSLTCATVTTLFYLQSTRTPSRSSPTPNHISVDLCRDTSRSYRMCASAGAEAGVMWAGQYVARIPSVYLCNILACTLLKTPTPIKICERLNAHVAL